MKWQPILLKKRLGESKHGRKSQTSKAVGRTGNGSQLRAAFSKGEYPVHRFLPKLGFIRLLCDYLRRKIVEVDLTVPAGTDVTVIREQYPDLCEDEGWEDEGIQRFWCGHSTEEDDIDFEWFTYDEATEFCGFCEGAIEDAACLIEGNGGWAQGMISRRDFSTLATTAEQKAIWKKTSDRYWSAHERGRKARLVSSAERLNAGANKKH